MLCASLRDPWYARAGMFKPYASMLKATLYSHIVAPSAARFTAGCTSVTLEVTLLVPSWYYYQLALLGAIGGLAIRLPAARLKLMLRGLQSDVCTVRGNAVMLLKKCVNISMHAFF